MWFDLSLPPCLLRSKYYVFHKLKQYFPGKILNTVTLRVVDAVILLCSACSKK